MRLWTLSDGRGWFGKVIMVRTGNGAQYQPFYHNFVYNYENHPNITYQVPKRNWSAKLHLSSKKVLII